MSFDIKVSSSYQDTNIKLEHGLLDGGLENSREVSVGTSYASVTLPWTAQAGDHLWRVEVLEDGKLKAEKYGEIIVDDSSTTSCLSGVPVEGHLEVSLAQIKAGDSMLVHVTVKNLDANCEQGPFNIELVDDSGVVLWPAKDGEYGCFDCGYVIQDGVLKIHAGKQ